MGLYTKPSGRASQYTYGESGIYAFLGKLLPLWSHLRNRYLLENLHTPGTIEMGGKRHLRGGQYPFNGSVFLFSGQTME